MISSDPLFLVELGQSACCAVLRVSTSCSLLGCGVNSLHTILIDFITPAIKYPHSIGLYSRSNIIKKYSIFSPLSGQPKNIAIIHSAISYVSARDLRLFNCQINNNIIPFAIPQPFCRQRFVPCGTCRQGSDPQIDPQTTEASGDASIKKVGLSVKNVLYFPTWNLNCGVAVLVRRFLPGWETKPNGF